MTTKIQIVTGHVAGPTDKILVQSMEADGRVTREVLLGTTEVHEQYLHSSLTVRVAEATAEDVARVSGVGKTVDTVAAVAPAVAEPDIVVENGEAVKRDPPSTNETQAKENEA